MPWVALGIIFLSLNTGCRHRAENVSSSASTTDPRMFPGANQPVSCDRNFGGRQVVPLMRCQLHLTRHAKSVTVWQRPTDIVGGEFCLYERPDRNRKLSTVLSAVSLKWINWSPRQVNVDHVDVIVHNAAGRLQNIPTKDALYNDGVSSLHFEYSPVPGVSPTFNAKKDTIKISFNKGNRFVHYVYGQNHNLFERGKNYKVYLDLDFKHCVPGKPR